VALAQSGPPTQSTSAIKREVLAERAGFQAVRVTFAPGATGTATPQGYDEVIVPIDGTLAVELEGTMIDWRPGVTILIPRGAPHRVRNTSAAPATFVSVRRRPDAEIKPPPIPQTKNVTVVKSAESRYIRATTVRFERGGEIHGVGDAGRGPTVFVLAAGGPIRMTIASTIDEPGPQRAGTAWIFEPGMAFGLVNTGSAPVEAVRISAPER
jgi:quercetin dioxygenase-like cupin family protein